MTHHDGGDGVDNHEKDQVAHHDGEGVDNHDLK